jgi:radical SAM superfamily enzyme YgiQ (UPF0313 family)
MQHLANDLKKLKLPVRQFQDFTPTPGTIATAMYVSEMDRKGSPIYVAKNFNERQEQRACLQKLLTPQPKKGKDRHASPPKHRRSKPFPRSK